MALQNFGAACKKIRCVQEGRGASGSGRSLQRAAASSTNLPHVHIDYGHDSHFFQSDILGAVGTQLLVARGRWGEEEKGEEESKRECVGREELWCILRQPFRILKRSPHDPLNGNGCGTACTDTSTFPSASPEVQRRVLKCIMILGLQISCQQSQLGRTNVGCIKEIFWKFSSASHARAFSLPRS